MPQPYILTFADILEAANDFIGALSASAAQRDLRRAVQNAYREVLNAHRWTFSLKQGRVVTQAAHTTGTAAYEHTGRQVTFSSTLPSWVSDTDKLIALKISGTNALHLVDSYVDSTHVTLDATLNPGADVSASSFQLYPLAYHLPHDFHCFDGPWSETYWRWGRRVDYQQMMALHRFNDTTGDLVAYCLRADPDLHGTWSLYLYPANDESETIDFLYQRYGRQLRHSGHAANDRAGTIAINGTAVTGTGTAFSSTMVGALLRVGDTSNVPTGLEGLYPYSEQQTISAVTDATHLTLSQSLSTTSGAKYYVSDIVDIEYAAQEALFACVRKHLAYQRNMKNKAEFAAEYRDALLRAKGADNRDRQTEVIGRPQPGPYRLRDIVTIKSDL